MQPTHMASMQFKCPACSRQIRINVPVDPQADIFPLPQTVCAAAHPAFESDDGTSRRCMALMTLEATDVVEIPRVQPASGMPGPRRLS